MLKRKRASTDECDRILALLDHRLRPSANGQLDILVEVRLSSRQVSRKWEHHEHLHRQNHDLLMKYWDSFPGGINGQLAELWTRKFPDDIPHFPSSIISLKPARPSSRVPALAVVDWVGWHKEDRTEEPLDQVAVDMPELLHDYYRRHGTAALMSPNPSRPPLDQLIAQLRTKKNLVVVTGAGISISAGISDFSELRGRFGPHVFHISALAGGSSTASFHDVVRHLHREAASSQPTKFHRWLDTQACSGRLRRVYTQNIDGIEQQLPHLQSQVPLSFHGPWSRCVQLHGSIFHVYCDMCRSIYPLEPHLFRGSRAPPCPRCVAHQKRKSTIGHLRPRIRLYDQSDGAVNDEAVQTVVAHDAKINLDALLVVGTSLKVPGAVSIVNELLRSVRLQVNGGLTAWINPATKPPSALTKRFDFKVDITADRLAELLEQGS